MIKSKDALLAAVPMLAPAWLLFQQLPPNPLPIFTGWIQFVFHKLSNDETPLEVPPVESQLLAYLTMAILGYLATNNLVPKIKKYTLQKGICGRDLGKRGTSIADKEIPEALGIAPGIVFLICLILCLVGYATSHPAKLLDCNSALLSICFMLFLGFTDDVLDWPWRYKLLLPFFASLPLLCCYDGSTTIVVPIQLRSLLVKDGSLTLLGSLITNIIAVDGRADGSLVDLGLLYKLYMLALAVFCTNAINIYAGINGLEAGQSFVIGCAVLVHNMLEILSSGENGTLRENHLFSVMIMVIFVGVTLGLLRHNWYPASVFVGDTYCYFAGMTFAVVGILGHFSKTLLLFFIPQVLNFLWSTPQLFKFVPCPRHRLPEFNPATGKMEPSTFACSKTQYKWLKKNPNDTEVPNMTVINLCLQLLGPMSERMLCIVLLGFQIVCCGVGLLLRYHVAQYFFDE